MVPFVYCCRRLDRGLFLFVLPCGNQDNNGKQDKESGGGHQSYVKNIEIGTMLVEVDNQKDHDDIEQNHVGNLLSINFGRGIYVKRPPEDEVSSGLESSYSKEVNLHFQRDFRF